MQKALLPSALAPSGRRARHTLRPPCAFAAPAPPSSTVSLEELRELAQVCGCGRPAVRCSPALQSRGLALAFSTLGPFFKASVTLLREPGSEPVGVLEVRSSPFFALRRAAVA